MADVSPDFDDKRKFLQHTAVTVGTSQVHAKGGVSLNPQVEELLLYNDSTNTIYVGLTGVTASGAQKGLPLPKGTSMSVPTDAFTQVFMIAASGSNAVLVFELGE